MLAVPQEIVRQDLTGGCAHPCAPAQPICWQQRGLALEQQLCLLPSPEPRTDALRVQRCSQFSAAVDGVELLAVDLRPLRLWPTMRHCRPFVSHGSAL